MNSLRKRYGVMIYDCEVEQPSATEFYKTVSDYSPRLVLFVATGQNPNASTAAMAGATEASSVLGNDFAVKRGHR